MNRLRFAALFVGAFVGLGTIAGAIGGAVVLALSKADDLDVDEAS